MCFRRHLARERVDFFIIDGWYKVSLYGRCLLYKTRGLGGISCNRKSFHRLSKLFNFDGRLHKHFFLWNELLKARPGNCIK